MDIQLVSGSYKSISELVWTNIPTFAVITGPNGSGKTHLLELIARKLGVNVVAEGMENARMGMSQPIAFDANLQISVDFKPQDVVFHRSRWLPARSNASLESVISLAQSAWAERDGANPDRKWEHLWSTITEKTGKERAQIEEHEFFDALPPNFILLSDTQQLTPSIAELFVSYLHCADTKIRKGLSLEQAFKSLEPLPWHLLNQLFETTSLPYRVVTPSLPERAPFSNKQITYQLLLEDSKTGLPVPPAELSSGERVMFQMALWLFSFKQRYEHNAPSSSNRFLLLDEPDAHLHPALTKSFLDAIRSVFVEMHGIRVIMTTHSPSTVALTPESNLFVMTRDDPRIRPVKSKWQAVSQLTAGLLTIGSDSKCVFVEGSNDRKFYRALQLLLTNPRDGTPTVDSSRSIVFIDASKGHPGDGNGKPSGGSNNVAKWVNAIESTQIAGIIDLDNGNVGTDRIHVISRYNHENYLLDPLFLYSVLLEKGNAPPIPNISLGRHDAQKLLTLDPSILQVVLDAILSDLKSLLPNLPSQSASTSHPVEYHNGPQLRMQEWFIKYDAKKLLEPVSKKFDVNREYLIERYALMEIVPSELVTIFRNIQGA
jgi:predicted ATPase